ncbi:WXG100 family type VII secretion target [Streptacidiphilus sp. EB129]|uniref:WXG100 family type VII secretion target n=1 Tax=Streptacidiphilus sp. EB129 TaxID=3156262 RepID=UPI003511B5F1
MTYDDPVTDMQNAADAQWKQALAANAGGHKGAGGFTTDFENSGGLVGLRKMIMDADPEAIHKTSSRWMNIHDQLHGTADDLGTHVSNLLQNWSGDSADAFKVNAQSLHDALTNGAEYARVTSGAMTDAAIGLSEAQTKMPHMPSNWDKFSRSVTSEKQDWQFKQDAADHGLSWAVDHDGSQLSVLEQRHQQAVLVMEDLGTKYNNAAAQLVTPPPHSGGDSGWPPPPAPVPVDPVHQPRDTAPAGPGSGGYTGGGAYGGEKVRPVSGGHIPPDPGHFIPPPNHQPPPYGHGPISPVQPVAPLPPGSTLDGNPWGPTTGGGGGNGGGGNGGYGGPGGVGSGGGAGGGGRFGGVGTSGFGGGGLGGAGGGFGMNARGAGGLGGEGLGGSGLAGESGLAAEAGSAEGSASAAAANEAKLAAGEGAAGPGEGGAGMGMGGMGGARGAGNKKKRKARAAYLVEDDETWAQDGAPNPPVIG